MKVIDKRVLRDMRRLGKMKDKDIDFSEIPEVTSLEGWVQGKFYRPVKKPITIRLDADVLDWLKTGGDGYQTRVNEVLRKKMMFERRQRKRA